MKFKRRKLNKKEIKELTDELRDVWATLEVISGDFERGLYDVSTRDNFDSVCQQSMIEWTKDHLKKASSNLYSIMDRLHEKTY